MESKSKTEEEATLDVLILDFMVLLRCEALFVSPKYGEIALHLLAKAQSFNASTLITVCTHTTTKESCKEMI